jgi:hypothetical protein
MQYTRKSSLEHFYWMYSLELWKWLQRQNIHEHDYCWFVTCLLIIAFLRGVCQQSLNFLILSCPIWHSKTRGPWVTSLTRVTLAKTEGYSLSIRIYFLLWHLYTIACNVQGRSLPGNSTGLLYLWFRGWDLNSFRDNRAFPV